MTTQKVAVNRHLVGLLALMCLVAAGIILLGFGNNLQLRQWGSAFLRVGLVLAAFWIALPTRYRDAAWAEVNPLVIPGFVVAFLLLAYRPRIGIPILVVAAVFGFLLRPRRPKRPKQGHHGSDR